MIHVSEKEQEKLEEMALLESKFLHLGWQKDELNYHKWKQDKSRTSISAYKRRLFDSVAIIQKTDSFSLRKVAKLFGINYSVLCGWKLQVKNQTLEDALSAAGRSSQLT